MPNFCPIFPSLLTIVAQFFLHFFWTSSSKFVPCVGGGGGMIGGGGCRIEYVMWMDGLVRICVVCLGAVNTAAINPGFYPLGLSRALQVVYHMLLPANGERTVN